MLVQAERNRLLQHLGFGNLSAELAGRFGKFISISFQLGLLLLVTELFRIEANYGFRQLAPLILIGFVIHAWLPLRLRLPFFLFLSLVAIVTLLGVAEGLCLIAIGLLLIGVSHLRWPLAVRIALLLAVAGLLALARVEWIQAPISGFSSRVVPLLGAMFMFRLVVYLYDFSHEKKPASIWERLSYFFLLPSPCFPLFPVVDYSTFRRTYFHTDEYEIYQRAMLRFFRGITHLLLYRVVYFYFTPNPSGIADLAGVVLYAVSSYLLYLRISGLFHLIVGILGLFGFDLPETHRRYFLASSFTDFWRRINIYWKDFMEKLFYYPIFLSLKRLGLPTAMAVTAILTLLCSWLLHSYQWFWLRGTFPLRIQDGVFWTLLGIMVAVNSIYEAKFGRRRSLKASALTFGKALSVSVKTVAMFSFMSVLWSFWTCTSVSEWLSVFSIAAHSSFFEVGAFILALVTAVLAGVLIQFAVNTDWKRSIQQGSYFFWRASYTGAASVILILTAAPFVTSVFGIKVVQLVESVKGNQLNTKDQELMTRGYYEELLGTESWGSALWSVNLHKPLDWNSLALAGASERTDDARVYKLVPNVQTTFKGASFRVNEWGMRDQSYQLQKPPGTFRFALLGASYTMGSGVADGEVFESLVEERLNNNQENKGPSMKFEIMNFGIGGYTILNCLVQAQKKVFDFSPDVVIFTSTADEVERIVYQLRDIIESGIEISDPFLQDIIRRANVTEGHWMGSSEIDRRLKPYSREVVRHCFLKLVELSRSRGAVPVWVYIPRTENEGKSAHPKLDVELKLAREAGFASLVLENVYGEIDRTLIQVAPWDVHPNAEGHKLIANRFYEALSAWLARSQNTQRTNP